jgi:hypothetical protein
MVDSDSDDEIEFVGRSSPRKSIVHVDDSDEDRKPAIGSSQSSRLKSSQPTSSPSSHPRRWIRVWSSMSLSDRRHTINQELRGLKQPPVIRTPDAIRAIANRREAVKQIEGSGCLMQWNPPDPLVLQALPTLYVHPRLADTFERPKPAAIPAINPMFPASAVAGPSTQPMPGVPMPGVYQQFVNSLGECRHPSID